MEKEGHELERPIDDEEADDEEFDFSPFLEYLKSDRGHELASRVLGIVEDLKKGALEKNANHAKFERTLQVTVIAVVVLASSFLTYTGKFDASVGVLFGTMVGYLFGKK